MSTYTSNQDVLTTKVTSTGGSISVNLTEKLAIQDAFGRMTQIDIRKFWQTLTTKDTKRAFIWLAFTCLSQDSALDILKLTTLRDAKDELEQAMEREQVAEWDKINAERSALARQQTAERGVLADLTSKNTVLEQRVAFQQSKIDQLRQERDALERETSSLTNELEQYRQVIEGLKVLKNLLA